MSKIETVETVLLDLPTIRGHVLAMATMTTQSVVLVRIRFADGSEGWGEGTTIGGMSYGPESPEGIKPVIDAYVAPALIGQDGDAVNPLTTRLRKLVKGNEIAHCAVENALWDGVGHRLGRSVAALMGGRRHDTLPVAWTLASGDLATDIAEAEQMIDTRRHNIFKLKIGKRSIRDDVAHVGAIAEALGDRGSIRVDVNQAWSPPDARVGLAALEAAGVVLAEQPVKAGMIGAMAELTRATRLAVMADEALSGPESALRFAAAGAADVFAVKMEQSGGLRRAAEVVAIAEAAGIGLYGGTMLESGVSTAMWLQLFSTVETMAWGTEMFGALLLKDEILTEPLVYRDFSVEIPDGPGSGVRPDPDRIAFFRRDRA